MKNAYYFSHDSNAQFDEKTIALRMKYGWEGYGIFWAIIETLFDSNNNIYSLDKIDRLAYSLNTDITLLKGVINTCITEGLFKKKDNCFYSESLNNRIDEWKSKREQKSNAGKAGMKKRWAGHNTVITENNKVKESKVKESKVKKERVFSPPSLKDIEEYIKEKNYNIDAERFYDFFTVANWVDSKGHKVKNWKQKLITWSSYNNEDQSTNKKGEKWEL